MKFDHALRDAFFAQQAEGFRNMSIEDRLGASQQGLQNVYAVTPPELPWFTQHRPALCEFFKDVAERFA